MGMGTECFKSCPRVGGIKSKCGAHGDRNVSSRAPVWGASFVCGLRCPAIRRFKSCPRVGGILDKRTRQKRTETVSSRAPVWGASSAMDRINMILQVSSRAPVWGASLFSAQLMPLNGFQVVPPCGGHLPPCLFLPANYKFQVVPPCGGHLKAFLIVFSREEVSSRAPVWGASIEGIS